MISPLPPGADPPAGFRDADDERHPSTDGTRCESTETLQALIETSGVGLAYLIYYFVEGRKLPLAGQGNTSQA